MHNIDQLSSELKHIWNVIYVSYSLSSPNSGKGDVCPEEKMMVIVDGFI